MSDDHHPSCIGVNDCTNLNNSDSEFHGEPRVCLVGSLSNDEDCLEAAGKIFLPVVTSLTGIEYANDTNYATYFVLGDFETSEFEELHKSGERILGKPAFLEQASEGALSYHSRPVYCHVMKPCVIVFTGFRKKSEVARLLKLVHFMGGSVKNEIKENVTHVLAHSSTGEKYQYAVTFNVPVMSEDWVNVSWAHRDEIGSSACQESMMKHHLKVFQNLRIVLLGFPEEDKKQMETLVKENNGYITSLSDHTSSHVVVEEQVIREKPIDCPLKAQVVKSEWFWASIQMDACANEKLYLFEDANATYASPKKIFSPSTPTSRSRRRKRLRETVQQLAQDDSPSTIQGVAPARVEKMPLSPPVVDLRLLSKRQRVFHELVKTECNYVAILDTIEKVLKEPLEDTSQPGGPVLDSQELRYIFGNLPPIHDVHKRIRNELLHLAHSWCEEASVGNIILSFTSDLEKAYPPFVNYFENVKEMLHKISMERPRFHAFLKIAQNKPECGRQSFQELLIRPVQRLPSMALLLNDILKHTDKDSPDYYALEQAVDKVKSIMSFINDDKRKTEAKLKLFEVHNDIENCPPNLVASHRTYITRVDTIELSDACCGRGDFLTLFLFNDILEICKKKNKYNSIKSPSRSNAATLRPIKSYKHLEMMPLAHIKRVVDIRETCDCHNVFAVVVRSNQELKERLYSFTIHTEQDITKQAFLRALCCNMANVVCRSDVENFMVSMDPHHLDIDTSDVSLTAALNRAIRFAARTGRKVSRAFSFNKSPGKLKRAVSTVMSPFGTLSNSALRGATSVNNLADISLNSTPPCCNTYTEGMITPTPRKRPSLKNM